MPLNKKLPIAISMGEPGGINIEIILKCGKKKLQYSQRSSYKEKSIRYF